MSLIRILGACALLGLTAGCSRTPHVDAPAPAAQAAPATSGRRSPVTLTLSGPSNPRVGIPITLTVGIERHLVLKEPLQLALLLPDGVTLLEGQATFELAPNAEPDTQTLRFVIRAKAMPTSDLRVILEARGQGFGLHAEQAYRFGRPPPLAPAPLRGTSVRVGQRNFGRSIDISAR